MRVEASRFDSVYSMSASAVEQITSFDADVIFVRFSAVELITSFDSFVIVCSVFFARIHRTVC